MKHIFSIATLAFCGFAGVLTFNATLLASDLPTAPTGQSNLPPIKGAPQIRFTTNFHDFGKISLDGPIHGRFKFKNTGDAPLKITELLPSCDCTDAIAKPDTLAPGESGEITYTVKMEHAVTAQRHIAVHSNDPQSPSVQLTMQFDYTPLYETTPSVLQMTLPAGKDETEATYIVNRKDGKALEIDRLVTSEKWLTAAFDPTYEQPQSTGFDVSLTPQISSARVIVKVHRSTNPPGLINASIAMWSSNVADRPVRSLRVTGEIEAELVANPARFYWVFANYGKNIKDYPAESLCRHIELKSVLGKSVEIKNATTNIKGMSVQVIPKEAGKTFDLVVKFDELPQKMIEGKVLIETSLDSVPKLEVNMTIASALE